MKKFLMKICCLLLCFASFGLVACEKNIDLYQKGVEVTTLMGEIVNSKQYLKLIGSMEDKIDLVKAKDYDSPTRVYQLSIPSFDILCQKFKTMDTSSFDELPDNLKEQIKAKFNFYLVLNNINNQYPDWDALVISSVLTADKTYNGKISSSTAYLYTFETGKPIVVVFEPFGDKQFTAKGYFIFADDVSTLSNVREIFEQYGCSVENVNR